MGETAKLMVTARMALLIPLILFAGFEMAFSYGALTKLIVTPNLGKQNVGFVMCSFGVCDAVGSAAFGKVGCIIASLHHCAFSSHIYLSFPFITVPCEPHSLHANYISFWHLTRSFPLCSSFPQFRTPHAAPFPPILFTSSRLDLLSSLPSLPSRAACAACAAFAAGTACLRPLPSLLRQLSDVVGRLPVLLTGLSVQLALFVWILIQGASTFGWTDLILLAGGLGLGDAVCQTLISSMCGACYGQKRQAAFSNFKLWQSAAASVCFFLQAK